MLYLFRMVWYRNVDDGNVHGYILGNLSVRSRYGILFRT